VAQSASSGGGAPRADINVTPMIDVMLVLLIIFMIVTPALAKGFQATIPRASHAESDPDVNNGEIRLGIDYQGKYFLDMTGANGQYTGMRPIADADLPTQLMAIYTARSVDKILYLKADGAVPFQRVQDAIEMARKAGVRVIAAISEKNRSVKKEDH
jgi:biopolymer transport protein TolR